MALDEFYQWATETFPLLYQCFGAFIYARVCPGLPVPQASGGVAWCGWCGHRGDGSATQRKGVCVLCTHCTGVPKSFPSSKNIHTCMHT